jgi:hypothetical protein
MAAKLARLTYKMAKQLHLVAENCTICNPRSRQAASKEIFWIQPRIAMNTDTRVVHREAVPILTFKIVSVYLTFRRVGPLACSDSELISEIMDAL